MIPDQNDPSGLGLYSKAGRQFTQKIPILASKKKSKQRKNTIKQTISIQMLQGQQTNKMSAESARLQPFSKCISRQKRNNRYQSINNNPSVGQYRVKNIDKSIHSVWNILEVYEKQKSNKSAIQIRKHSIIYKKNKQIQENQNKKQEQPTIDTSINAKSGCFIDMSRMTGRNNSIFNSISVQDIDLQKPELNGKQKFSNYLQNFNMKKGILFDKQIGRQEKSQKMTSTGLYYNANSDYTKKSLGKVGPKFDKILGRQDRSIKSSVNNSITYYDYDQYVWKGRSKIFRNTKINLIPYDKTIRQKK